MVGIVAVLIAPRLVLLTDYENRGLRDKLVAELQYARQAAIANRRYVCVNVTNGTGGKLRLTIETSAPESTSGTCDLDLNPPAPDKTTGCAANEICASTRTGLSSSQTLFQFDALGRLSPATAVTVSVLGETNIVIEAETGYVH